MIIVCFGDGVKIDFSVRVRLFLELYQSHSTDLKN